MPQKPITTFATAIAFGVFASAAIAAPEQQQQQAATPGSECHAAPKGVAPQGAHWYYKTDRATNKKCWYLADQVAKTKKATSTASTRSNKSDDDAPQVLVGMAPSFAQATTDSHTLKFDAHTGELLKDGRPGERFTFMGIMLALHMDLYAGLAGELFLGLMGLLFVIAVVSGAVLYGPFMKKLEFGTVRAQRSRRIKWLDLHNLLGDTHAVHITIDEQGAYSVDEVIKGDTVREVLNYVQYSGDELLRAMRKTVEKGVKEQKLSIEEARLLLRFYEDGLHGYTYLEDPSER